VYWSNYPNIPGKLPESGTGKISLPCGNSKSPTTLKDSILTNLKQNRILGGRPHCLPFKEVLSVRVKILVLVVLLMLVGIPAYAYGDPSGGTLFQILMPTLAALWAMWMIFANRVRRTVGNFVRRLRGSEPAKPNAE
jgi:hypothetical protein